MMRLYELSRADMRRLLLASLEVCSQHAHITLAAMVIKVRQVMNSD